MAERNFEPAEVIVKGLSTSVSALDIARAFESFGRVMSIKIFENEKAGTCYAVIGMRTQDMAENAVKAGAVDVLGDTRKITYARDPSRMPRKRIISNNRLYISGIPVILTIQELMDTLGECEINLPRIEERKKPFMFAKYADESTRNEKMMSLNGKIIGNSTVRAAPAINRGVYSSRLRGDHRQGAKEKST